MMPWALLAIVLCVGLILLGGGATPFVLLGVFIGVVVLLLGVAS